MKHVESVYYTCDICGKKCTATPQYSLPEEIDDYAYDAFGAKITLCHSHIEEMQYDLCLSCQKKLQSIIKGMKTIKDVDMAELIGYDGFRCVINMKKDVDKISISFT